MQFVSNTDALIIDLRNNSGGNATMAMEVLSYFFTAKTYTGRSFNRVENKWSDTYVENKKAITQGLMLTMPVYILTSSRTYSAAEGFAYTLHNIKGSTVIGDTTRGGAHLTRSFSLGNGFVAFIPYVRGEDAKTKTDWEGTGVVPDINAEESSCIATAVNAILVKKLATVTDENEKRKITYQINLNKSKSNPSMASPADATKYTGRFAEFEITVKEGQLMFRDVNQPGNNPRKMIALSTTFFQVGNDYQVEFIMNEHGVCSSIKMYWDDGWVEIIQRSI